MRILAVINLLLVAVLSGCASLPNDAPPFSPAPVAPDGYATVYLYRVGAFPTLRKPDVLVSGFNVYEPPERAYTWVHVKAGEAKFGIEWAWDTKWPPVNFTHPLVAGQSYYIKISGSFENRGLTHVLGSSAWLVPPDKAARDLADCCKYVKAKIQRVD